MYSILRSVFSVFGSLGRRIVFHNPIQMEEEQATAEDILTFNAVGNWRTIKNDEGKYEKVFVPGTDVTRMVRIILRFEHP